MHFFMMALYAAITAVVLAAIDSKAQTNRQRVLHGLKTFGGFLGIGLLLSLILYPLPW
jgi:hypothetical protein